MRIASTQYSGKYEALEVYVSGCTMGCPGCHNEELWDFSLGDKITTRWLNELVKKINANKNLIKRVWILGGEPLDQDQDQLISLIMAVRACFVEVWLFTGYELESIPAKIVNLCDYIKCGPYRQELQGENVQLGVPLSSINQYIVKTGGEIGKGSRSAWR